MSTLTLEQQNQITQTLSAMPVICAGLGNAESACSLAAINLALNGKLTDSIPDCMSIIIGEWIIRIQDQMPESIRNSPRWRALLPLAAGTGREREQERFGILMEWVWGTVLPQVTPAANEGGVGSEWAQMLTERTPEAARAASSTASATSSYSYAARVASFAAYAASYDISTAAAAAAAAAASAAAAFNALYALGISDQYWTTIDPCAILERLLLTPLTPESTP